MATHTPVSVRFHQRYEMIPEVGCWIWTGSERFRGGYGTICDYKKPLAGMCVLHRCDTPLCVNPDHLFLGTTRDNNVDRARKNRSHHPRGELQGAHKLTEKRVAHIRGLPWLPFVVAKRLAFEWGVTWQHLYAVRAGVDQMWAGETSWP